MQPLRLVPASGSLEILCLGAHCDDIEIGCGGTLIELLATVPNVRVNWTVFSSDAVRAAEAREAARQVLGDRAVSIDVLEFRDGHFPYVGSEIKECFESIKQRVRPDLVFTHWLSDRHQDHRTIGELTWNTFRNHLILEYEIPKYEGDLGNPNLLVPLSEQALAKKIATIRGAFVSQREKSWFSESTFRSLARLRGIECNAPSGYAEAFHCRKTTIAFP